MKSSASNPSQPKDETAGASTPGSSVASNQEPPKNETKQTTDDNGQEATSTQHASSHDDNVQEASLSGQKRKVRTDKDQQQQQQQQQEGFLSTTPTTAANLSLSSSSGSSDNNNNNSSSDDDEDDEQRSTRRKRKQACLQQQDEIAKSTSIDNATAAAAAAAAASTTNVSTMQPGKNSSNVNNASTSSSLTATTAAATATTTTADASTTPAPAPAATTPTATTTPASTTTTTTTPVVNQPDGWRVKLYRLNADGSWDDCGTGRILCLYRNAKQQQQQSSATSTTSTDEKNNNNSNKSHEDAHSATPGSATTESTDTTTTAEASHDKKERGASPGNDSHAHASNPNAPKVGTDQWLYQETGEATLCVQAEVTRQHRQPRVLLRTRILLRDVYQRQGDNIITWCEPYYGQQQQQQQSGGNSAADQENGETSQQQQQQGVDLALSFQDNAGCLDIWRQIMQVQSRAAELIRQLPPGQTTRERAAEEAARTHADLILRQQQLHQQHHQQQQQQQHDQQEPWDAATGAPGTPNPENAFLEIVQSLPSPPTVNNIEEIADTIAALQHVQQKEGLAEWIAKDECAYLKQMLAIFPAGEAHGDYGKLATLAACVKTILLLNDPTILELIVGVADIFEQVCSCLEYDPDLREKANHRWFLRERAKFRAVIPMDDPDLVAAIHRSFRVNYLRDTLLRPTMDESALSTLSSLQTFTHADVVKGVTMSGNDTSLKDSYLIRVIRMLGIELHALCCMEWAELEAMPEGSTRVENTLDDVQQQTDPSIVYGKHTLGSATWKQYLAPQDGSKASRRLRRRGCLSFLRELFSMVRISLQQSDKDDFFAVICTVAIDLNEERDISDNVSQTSQTVEVGSVASTVKSDRGMDEKSGDSQQNALLDAIATPQSPVNFLSLLGNVMSDPEADISEKAAALEIIASVAMHDPNLIRRHCLEYHAACRQDAQSTTHGNSNTSSTYLGRPEPNERRQAIFFCPQNDLLASLLFLLDAETDAGALLQVSEIMKVILETDMMGDHGPMAAGFGNEADGGGLSSGSGNLQNTAHDPHNQSAVANSEQNQFLALFYESYVEWLTAPFQLTILHPIHRVPQEILRNRNRSDSPLMRRIMASFRKGMPPEDVFLKTVQSCAVRHSFAVELLSFCVRAHLYRMKFFLLKSSVLGSVLKLLRPYPSGQGVSGDRCLKLAALRFLRAILSVNDESYHRHIIQHNLFAPVFEAFRANPVGDNLVSSAIVEMCDYIQHENIKPLLEYIVTKHLMTETHPNAVPSLEDVSSPYVTTLTTLREKYETNLTATRRIESIADGQMSPGGSRYFPGGSSTFYHGGQRHLSGRALEDQRKFREVDEEESYFGSDDDVVVGGGGGGRGTVVPPAVDEVAAVQQQQQQNEQPLQQQQQQAVEGSDLHRTPRMFSLSLAQAPSLGNGDNEKEEGGERTATTEESTSDAVPKSAEAAAPP